MLVAILLQEIGKDEPFTSSEAIAGGVGDCLNNIESLARRSFQKFFFVNERDSVHFVTWYRSRTTVNSKYWVLDLNSFEHIELVSRFMFLYETGSLLRCTQCGLRLRVKVMSVSYLFGLKPKLTQGWCPEAER